MGKSPPGKRSSGWYCVAHKVCAAKPARLLRVGFVGGFWRWVGCVGLGWGLGGLEVLDGGCVRLVFDVWVGSATWGLGGSFRLGWVSHTYTPTGQQPSILPKPSRCVITGTYRMMADSGRAITVTGSRAMSLYAVGCSW